MIHHSATHNASTVIEFTIQGGQLATRYTHALFVYKNQVLYSCDCYCNLMLSADDGKLCTCLSLLIKKIIAKKEALPKPLPPKAYKSDVDLHNADG